MIATPDLVHVQAGVARNFLTRRLRRARIQHGDVAKGGVPRLGPAVPRWYGETIGFWDKDVLITWTSNIQGWKSHSEFEFSNKMQSVEIYTPIRERRQVHRPEPRGDPLRRRALVEPIRIVRNFTR